MQCNLINKFPSNFSIRHQKYILSPGNNLIVSICYDRGRYHNETAITPYAPSDHRWIINDIMLWQTPRHTLIVLIVLLCLLQQLCVSWEFCSANTGTGLMQIASCCSLRISISRFITPSRLNIQTKQIRTVQTIDIRSRLSSAAIHGFINP